MLLMSMLISPASHAADRTFAIGEHDFLLDGKPIVIRCGEMHFARAPREYWSHRLKMCRAMGLNAVCAYLYWNQHEPVEGKFDFTGQNDVAEFCRLAQAEGLLVILRPGPYSCAEWDFGGFPWWLLKHADIKVRTQDPVFLAACRRYIDAVGRQLAPLQITRGGPIIMVQVENEYGSYGNDRQYMGILRDYVKAAGFDVPFFTCDGPSQLKNDVRDDVFCVVNFGSNPAGAFKALRDIRPTGPLMCGEFYPGWFDSWGKKHHKGAVQSVVNDLHTMLDMRASFSIYMVHGGTSFGFTAGANSPPFSPQTTSYDYDAPISEAGWDTEKFHAIRKLFAEHLNPGENITEVPPRNPVISIPRIELNQVAPLLEFLPAPRREDRPASMEMYDQPAGCVLYRTRLAPSAAATLSFTDLNDYGLIFLDGKKIATLDRRRGQRVCEIPARSTEATLDVLVDTFGRINFGPHIHDRKGMFGRVELATGDTRRELTGWEIFQLPLDKPQIAGLRFSDGKTGMPAFYRGTFRLDQTGDTFLDMSTWGKGVVWVNGHNLGRYWNIGPTQTMYCPAPWLNRGENEIVVFEINGADSHAIAGRTEPILDQVKVDYSAVHRKPGQSIKLDPKTAVYAGAFAPGNAAQTVQFSAPADGRYLCIESLSSHTDDPYATIAELYALDPAGKDLPRGGWRIVFADSEETDAENGSADNVFDLQPGTFWHTEWSSTKPAHPHQIVIDLGKSQTLTGIRYVPRPDQPGSDSPGRVREYRVYLSDKLFEGL